MRNPARDLEDALKEALAEMGDAAQEQVEAFIEDAANSLVRKLRTGKRHGGRTPERTGEYAEGWELTSEMKSTGRVFIIRNTTKPFLSYILEYGKHGKTAQPHIRPAIQDTVNEIKEATR